MRISVFDNQHLAIKELPEERQGAFWMAFFAYVFEGIEPAFSDPMERMAWKLVLPHIEKSLTASENGSGGKGKRDRSKPESKEKSKLESNPKSKPESEQGKQAGKQALSEEKRREGLGESLKDSPTTSCAVRAGGDDPAPPRAADAETMAHRADHEAMVAAAVPCPDHLLAKEGQQ